MLLRARFVAAISDIIAEGVEFIESPQEQLHRPATISQPCSPPSEGGRAQTSREPGRDAAWTDGSRNLGWRNGRPVLYDPISSLGDDLGFEPADDVFIRVQSSDRSDAGAVRVCTVVADAFFSHGFEVRWNGNADITPRVIFP